MRTTRRSRRSSWGRRSVGAVLTALVLGVVVAPPAWAHTDTTEPSATNYVSHVTGFSAPLPSVTARMVDATTNIEVRNDGPDDLIVLGYEGEPYLRIGPSGTYENTHSPTPAMNDPMGMAPTPTVAPGSTATVDPYWRKTGSVPVARWHDHRTHWMGSEAPPSGDQTVDRVVVPNWTLPVKVGMRSADITGEVVWEPPPSPAAFLVLALAIAGLLFVIALVDELVALMVTGGLTVILGVVECVAVIGSPESSSSVQLIVFGPVALAAVGGGLWFLHHDDRRSGRLLIVAAAVVVGVLAGLVRLSYLGANELPSPLPAGLARADVAMAIGVALGALLIGAWQLLRSWPSTRRPTASPVKTDAV